MMWSWEMLPFMVDRLWRAFSMVFSGRVNISFTQACTIKNSSSDIVFNSSLGHLSRPGAPMRATREAILSDPRNGLLGNWYAQGIGQIPDARNLHPAGNPPNRMKYRCVVSLRMFVPTHKYITCYMIKSLLCRFLENDSAECFLCMALMRLFYGLFCGFLTSLMFGLLYMALV